MEKVHDKSNSRKPGGVSGDKRKQYSNDTGFPCIIRKEVMVSQLVDYCPYCDDIIAEKSLHMGSDGYIRHCCCDKPMLSSEQEDIDDFGDFLSSLGFISIEKIASRVANSFIKKANRWE